jgi:hypothetical protein
MFEGYPFSTLSTILEMYNVSNTEELVWILLVFFNILAILLPRSLRIFAVLNLATMFIYTQGKREHLEDFVLMMNRLYEVGLVAILAKFNYVASTLEHLFHGDH